MFSIRSKLSGLNSSDSYQVQVNVSNRTLFRIFGVTFVFLLAVAAIRQAAPALTLRFTSYFLALALNAPVHWIAQHLPGKKRGNRSLATILSAVIVLVVVVAFLASIVPSFVRQIGGLVDTVPTFVSDLKDDDSQIGSLIKRYNLQDQVNNFTADISSRLQGFAGSAVGAVSSFGSSAFALLTVLALTFMMLVEGPHWVKVGDRLVPERHRQRTRDLTRAMYKVVKGYVNGQVILAAIAAVLILPVLILTGVAYPVALMVIVFICGLIPMVGHTIGAVIVTAIALFSSPPAALIVLAYYILYQQVENYWVQPKIQANSTNMSPLLVFAAVVLGVNFGGLLGGLVAIPVMGCVRILLLDELSRRHILESQTPQKAAKEAKEELKPAKAKSK